jgi:hypothetical protein
MNLQYYTENIQHYIHVWWKVNLSYQHVAQCLHNSWFMFAYKIVFHHDWPLKWRYLLEIIHVFRIIVIIGRCPRVITLSWILNENWPVVNAYILPYYQAITIHFEWTVPNSKVGKSIKQIQQVKIKWLNIKQYEGLI